VPIRNGAPVGAPTWIDIASSGLMNNDPQWDAPDGWTTYIHTADIKASLATAIEAGAVTPLPFGREVPPVWNRSNRWRSRTRAGWPC
jgi:hypothetical protein